MPLGRPTWDAGLIYFVVVVESITKMAQFATFHTSDIKNYQNLSHSNQYSTVPGTCTIRYLMNVNVGFEVQHLRKTAGLHILHLHPSLPLLLLPLSALLPLCLHFLLLLLPLQPRGSRSVPVPHRSGSAPGPRTANTAKRIKKKGEFFWFFLFMYDIQHCFICRPSDSTVSEDAGIEPRTVATNPLAVRRSKHSARSHPQKIKKILFQN